MQWVQDTNESNVDNPNSVKREAGRHIRNKCKEYLIDNFDYLEANTKLKDIIGYYMCYILSCFTIIYIIIVKRDVIVKVLFDYRLPQYLARWRNYFSQLLNIHGV